MDILQQRNTFVNRQYTLFLQVKKELWTEKAGRLPAGFSIHDNQNSRAA